MNFDLQKELLPGLPAYVGGRMSDAVYNAGDGLYDTRVIENPDEIPFFVPGPMSEEEFHAAWSALDCGGVRYHFQYAPGGFGLRMYYNRRIIDIAYVGGVVTATRPDLYIPAERTPV